MTRPDLARVADLLEEAARLLREASTSTTLSETSCDHSVPVHESARESFADRSSMRSSFIEPRRGWSDVATPDMIGHFLRAAERLGTDPPGERVADDWRAWPAASWLLMHGLRASEVQHLRVRDIDLLHGIVHVRDRDGARTKSQRSDRAVPILSERAREALVSLLRDRQHEPDAPAIPMGRQGRAGKSGRSQWLARRCELTCVEAGIERLSPHALRHTVATLAITAGADVHSVQALLGHESARVTTRIYSHAIAGAQAMEAARAVGAWLDRAVAARPQVRVVRDP